MDCLRVCSMKKCTDIKKKKNTGKKIPVGNFISFTKDL